MGGAAAAGPSAGSSASLPASASGAGAATEAATASTEIPPSAPTGRVTRSGNAQSGSNGNGNGNASGSSSSSASNNESSTGLESIDSIVSAIQSIASSVGSSDPATAYTLISQSLLPALTTLEKDGLQGGIPASMVFQSALSGNRDPLQVLMEQPYLTGNGVGFLFILLARCQAEGASPDLLVPVIIEFIKVADPLQLRLASAKVGLLALWFAHFCAAQPGICIEPLYMLLRKLQGDGTTSDSHHYLTAVHPILMLASLRAGQFHHANHLIQSHPVSEVDPRNFPVTYQDNLKYHLYAGTISAVLSKYEQAIDLLETAVTAPAQSNATSMLQIDAYKRLILVQLLANGKTSSLPKYTSSHLLLTFKQLYETSYTDFGRAYHSLDRAKLYKLADEHRKVFETDGNFGLVQRALQAIPAQAISRLKDTYKVVEIEEVVRLLRLYRPGGQTNEEGQPPAFTDLEGAKSYVEHTVQDLIAQRKLAASIVPLPNDPSKRYLEFRPTPLSTTDASAALQRSLENLASTQWSVTSLDKRISHSREFLKKAYEAVPAYRAGADGMGFLGGFGGADEDIMDDKAMMT